MNARWTITVSTKNEELAQSIKMLKESGYSYEKILQTGVEELIKLNNSIDNN